MEGDDAINRWNSILKAGKVYHTSGLSVDVATDGERNVVTNNLQLVLCHERDLKMSLMIALTFPTSTYHSLYCLSMFRNVFCYMIKL